MYNLVTFKLLIGQSVHEILKLMAYSSSECTGETAANAKSRPTHNDTKAEIKVQYLARLYTFHSCTLDKNI